MSFTQVIQESRQSFKAEEDKYRIFTFDELKLNLLTLHNWVIWCSSESSIYFLLPRLEKSRISVEASLSVNTNLIPEAFYDNQPISLSLNFINDIRQVENLFSEIVRTSFVNTSETGSVCHHVNSAKAHIINAINEIEERNANELKLTDENNVLSSYLPRLQFILCQIENIMVAKNRRRYNIITQVFSHYITYYSYMSARFFY